MPLAGRYCADLDAMLSEAAFVGISADRCAARVRARCGGARSASVQVLARTGVFAAVSRPLATVFSSLPAEGHLRSCCQWQVSEGASCVCTHMHVCMRTLESAAQYMAGQCSASGGGVLPGVMLAVSCPVGMM